MPSWNDVLRELQNIEASVEVPLDIIRRKYLRQLHEKTGRSVIAYYSAFLTNATNGVEIKDNDMNGFMNAVHRIDCSKGLDIILHTPGGGVSATAAIVTYLRSKFGNDIRCFVPQLAMSAGTMIACACKEIYMGKQSSIGPIDPQFGGISTHGVLEEFEDAIQGVKKEPDSIPIWQTVVKKYHPSFIGECKKAIEFSNELVAEWLKTGMFFNDAQADEKIKAILDHIGSHSKTKQHDRHISIEEATKNGLKIIPLENDQELQDIILSIHHAFMCTFAKATKAVKIVENHIGQAAINFVQ